MGGVYVMGGAAFTPFEGGGSSAPALLAEAGFIWQPLSRFGVRFGGIYWDRKRTVPVTSGGCAPDCAERHRWTVVGAVAEATLYVVPEGRLRPFVAAGVGALQSTTKDHFNFTCSPTTQACIPSPFQDQQRPYEVGKISAAALASAGMEARVWRATLLAQARLLWLSNPGDAPATVTPVGVGLRF